MSKAHAVAHDLPYLRRYARALTGSQTSGDAYAAATLEALVKDPGLLDSEDSLRVTLFRLFSTIASHECVDTNFQHAHTGTAECLPTNRERAAGRTIPREETTAMKLIVAIIKPFKLDDVRQALTPIAGNRHNVRQFVVAFARIMPATAAGGLSSGAGSFGQRQGEAATPQSRKT